MEPSASAVYETENGGLPNDRADDDCDQEERAVTGLGLIVIPTPSVSMVKALVARPGSPSAEAAFWMDFEPSMECCRGVVENRILHDDPATVTTSVRILTHLIANEFKTGVLRSTLVGDVVQGGKSTIDQVLEVWKLLFGRAKDKLERLSRCLDLFYTAKADDSVQTEGQDVWGHNIYFVMMLEMSLLLHWRMLSLTSEMTTLRHGGAEAYLAKYKNGTFPYQNYLTEHGEIVSFCTN